MSRGAFIALLVIGWFVFKSSNKKPLLIVAFIGICIAGWSQMSAIQKDRYLSLVSSETKGSATAKGRVDGIISEFKLGFTRPIVGHGVGTTGEAKWHITGKTLASHNMYGELLIETGIIGFVLFMKLIFSVYRSIVHLRLNPKQYDFCPKGLVQAIYVVFFMYAVYSLNYYGVSQYYWYFFAGLIVAIHRIGSVHIPK
jgi:O-antigen ligase